MPHCRKVASLSLYTIAITPDPAALLNSLYIIIYHHQTTIYTNTQQQTPSSYSNKNCCKINNLRTLNFSVDINQQLTLAIKKLKSAILTPENGDWRMEERLTRERDRETDCISLTIKKNHSTSQQSCMGVGNSKIFLLCLFGLMSLPLSRAT